MFVIHCKYCNFTVFMEKKMAKFAAVQMIDYQNINQESIKEFTSSELKKKFKCKKVVELKDYRYKKPKVAEFAQISESELNYLSSKLMSIDLRNYSDTRYKKNKKTQIFIFSDDASSSAFAFDFLKEDCTIKLFDLNDENISDFTQAISIIQTSDETLSSLSEAKDLCESLNDIEHNLGISLVDYNAIDTIEEKISDIEDEVESSKESLEEIFDAKWD